MTNILSGITAGQLRRAITIKERIETLEGELNQILGSVDDGGAAAAPTTRRKGKMSAAGKARIIAAQKARWANYRKPTAAASSPAPKAKRKMPAAWRAKLAASARARWKKAKAAGKNAL
jgi:hypothetical protein